MNEPIDLTRRLAALDSCALSDALDSLQLPAAVAGLPPLSVRRRIAGSVVTVKLGPDPLAAGSTRHLGTAAIDAAAPGQIIVIEHSSGVECAGWGGVLSTGALTKGVAGVIIDGAARDIDEAIDLGFPIYGRAAIALTARGRAYEQDFDCELHIGGRVVNPGDYAVADSSGVVFVARARAREVVERAERIAARERLMVEAIRRSEPMTDALGRDYETMLDELDPN